MASVGELRAESQQRLKSAFTSIFERYGRDFSGESNEIDLLTGRIVLDCGFLRRKRSVDFGDMYQPQGKPSESRNPTESQREGQSNTHGHTTPAAASEEVDSDHVVDNRRDNKRDKDDFDQMGSGM